MGTDPRPSEATNGQAKDFNRSYREAASVSERDEGDVLADAEISVPLTANGVLALYSRLLDMVIGEEG